jgi:hypothetical protein
MLILKLLLNIYLNINIKNMYKPWIFDQTIKEHNKRKERIKEKNIHFLYITLIFFI